MQVLRKTCIYEKCRNAHALRHPTVKIKYLKTSFDSLQAERELVNAVIYHAGDAQHNDAGSAYQEADGSSLLLMYMDFTTRR